LSLNESVKVFLSHEIIIQSIIHGHNLKLSLVDNFEETFYELVSTM
jgi:hypothetical protein